MAVIAKKASRKEARLSLAELVRAGIDPAKPDMVAQLKALGADEIEVKGTGVVIPVTKAFEVEQVSTTEVAVRWMEDAPEEEEPEVETRAADDDEEDEEKAKKSAKKSNDDPAGLRAKIDAEVRAEVARQMKNLNLAAKPKRDNRRLVMDVKATGGVTRFQKMYDLRIKSGTAVFDSPQRAEAFADSLLCDIWGQTTEFGRHPDIAVARKNLQERGIVTKADVATFPHSVGGALVGSEFSPEIVHLVNQFGVGRKLLTVIPMAEAEFKWSKATSGLTVVYPQEGATVTPGADTWINLVLRARDGLIIVRFTRQINRDSIINLADYYATEIARVFAYQEDLNVFVGDGTSTYGGMVGFLPAFERNGLTLSTAAGLVNTDGTTAAGTWDDYEITHFHALMAKLPQYAWARGPKFACSAAFFNSVMQRIGSAAGGRTWQETVDGKTVPSFLGYPVEFVEVMPTTVDASGDRIDCLFGAFDMAAAIGDRETIQIDVSDQRYWDTLHIGMRGIISHDVNVHSIGDTTTPGPVVGLWQT